jgi:photosystem II stability/assembly factor-like uncharacterized protein
MKPKLFTILILILITSVCYAQSGWFTQNSGTNKFLTDVYFVDQNNGWATGWTGTILHTSDGGANWIDQNAPAVNAYDGIYFVDNQTGWAVGFGGRIVNTTDGGNTWNIQTSGTQYYIWDVFFLNADTGWTAGGEVQIFDRFREILYTTNGGNSWTTQLIENNKEPLRSIFFVDENNGFAVGEGSTVLHTTNGGNSWTEQAIAAGYHFYDVDFVNPATGWVVGHDLSLQHYAVIFNTIDGGNTWNLQTFNMDESLQGVCFVNDNTGYAVGGANTVGRVLHTTDGGVNWIPQNSNTSNPLTSVCFVDANNGWAVGFDGTIIHTTTGGIVGIGDDANLPHTIPDEFVLYNNYPNPFNPSTTIRYALPKQTNVMLKIYNILGQEIRTLVNERQSAGVHSVVWDSRNNLNQAVSSGIYIYRLQAGARVLSKKMILLE